MSPQMSPAAASATALVRVTVASGSRRVDLVLPGAVPLAEMVPELARSVGLLDPMTVHGGYRVRTAEGRLLATDAGLVVQGVEDGALLAVTAGVDDPAPRVYDDVVEAMTDVVERAIFQHQMVKAACLRANHGKAVVAVVDMKEVERDRRLRIVGDPEAEHVAIEGQQRGDIRGFQDGMTHAVGARLEA